jgi:hypothetical protein
MKSYKALLLTGLFTTGVLFSSPHTAFACTTPGCRENVPTFISGSVKDEQHKLVNDATVTVECVHNGQHNTKNTTSHMGFYSVSYTYNKCDENDHVTVTASKGGLVGTNTGTVRELRCLADIALINVIMVPEFGLITGALAFVTSAGSMIILRKRV